ncbi:hypothetical protein HDU90_004770 [Geranomyces variabilis]|nr:hypothetical protein HDU90_004770 [Geranomyces variabilis]
MQLLSRQSRLHAFAALLLALPAITRAQQPTSPAAAASSACQPSTLVSQACGVVRDLDLATSVSAADAAAADAQLQTIVAGLKPLENIAPACYGYLRQIYCGSVYPGCRNGITVYPCATACQFATDSCMTILTVLGKEHMLPDCAQGIAPSGNATRVPYPTTQCLGSAAPGAKIAVLDSQATAMATALPATVYSDGVDTQVIILMALYFVSLFGFIDLIVAFSRMRRSYSVVSWACVWILTDCVILWGQISNGWQIQRWFGSPSCRTQALMMTYLNQASYIWPFFFTFDVWYAVVRKRMRGTSERARFMWNAPFAFLLPVVPTVVLALKANPVGLNPPASLQPGFGPHVFNGWAMSTLPFVIVFAVSAGFFGGHAAYHLYLQRAAFDSTSASGKGSSSNTRSNSGKGSQRAQSRLSLVLFARVLSLTAIFLAVCVVANYQQMRAVFRGTYDTSDSNPGIREYTIAAIGIVVWLVLCTSSATWSKTLPGSLFAATFGTSSGSRNDPHTRSARSQTKSQLDEDMIELRSSPTQYSAHRSGTKVSAISGPFNVSSGHTLDAPQMAVTRQNTAGPYDGSAPLPDTYRSTAANDDYYAILYAAAADTYSDHWATRKGTDRSDRSLVDDGFEGAVLPHRNNTNGSGVRPPRRKKSATSQRSYEPEAGHSHFAEEIPAVPPLSISTTNIGSGYSQRYNVQRSPVSPTHRYLDDAEPSPVASIADSRYASRSRSQSRGRRDGDATLRQRGESPVRRERSQRRYYDVDAAESQSADYDAGDWSRSR